MSTATPDLIKSSPSPLRIGLVRCRFTVVLYLLVVGLQFLTNLAINGIVYLSVSDINKYAEQSATNSAFVTGTFLFVCGLVSATVDLRASALSGGSRTALTAASYVHYHHWLGVSYLVASYRNPSPALLHGTRLLSTRRRHVVICCLRLGRLRWGRTFHRRSFSLHRLDLEEDFRAHARNPAGYL